MSGYCDFSKSNNAVSAESSGRYPASRAAKILGVPARFVREVCGFASHGEYHHYSKYFNRVDYFDTQEIRLWMEGDADTVEERGMAFAESLAIWKAQHAEKPAAKIYSGVAVKWLEWGGTLAHPHATERTATGCTVEDAGGKFVTVKLATGDTVRKGRDTNGFEVISAEHVRIYFNA